MSNLFKDLQVKVSEETSDRYWDAECYDCHWQGRSCYLGVEKTSWEYEEYDIWCPRCGSENVDEAYGWYWFGKRWYYNIKWRIYNLFKGEIK